MTLGLNALEFELGYEFSNSALAIKALTHRSFANERGTKGVDNERLEFLGDAVIGLIIGHELWQLFPKMGEGDLSKRRAAIVNEAGLARVARRIGVGQFVRLGKGETEQKGADKDSILSDALEALWAALYLEAGFERARSATQKVFEKELKLAGDLLIRDPKTELQERIQSQGLEAPIYTIVSEEGPDHARVFTAAVIVNEKELARASGRSKKTAEQSAAKTALDYGLESGLASITRG